MFGESLKDESVKVLNLVNTYMVHWRSQGSIYKLLPWKPRTCRIGRCLDETTSLCGTLLADKPWSVLLVASEGWNTCGIHRLLSDPLEESPTTVSPPRPPTCNWCQRHVWKGDEFGLLRLEITLMPPLYGLMLGFRLTVIYPSVILSNKSRHEILWIYLKQA